MATSELTTAMPAFVLGDFLNTLPGLPMALALLTVAVVVTWRVLERRERAYQEELDRERQRIASLERARFEAITRIRTTHDKGAA